MITKLNNAGRRSMNRAKGAEQKVQLILRLVYMAYRSQRLYEGHYVFVNFLHEVISERNLNYQD